MRAPTRMILAATVVAVALAVTACGGASQTGSEESAKPAPKTATETPTPNAKPITREEVKERLDKAGLSPEDAGLFIISSSYDVEAIGLKLGEAGRVLIYVFPRDAAYAASMREYVSNGDASGYAVIEPVGNAVIAYEKQPASGEKSKVEDSILGE